MPPFLPPELVTITFDHLYDSLCYSPGRGTYETPIGAGFVFSHLSLVSKTWHSLALPFLVRNFEDASRSGAKVAQYLHHLRKYDLSKHVQSVAVTLRSENGKSKCPLVQELFAEVGPVWKPRMVQIDSDDKEEFTGRECLAASLPFFRDTSSLRLIDIDFSFPRQWIPHLPARLAILECRYILRATDDEYLSTSLQLEIARICSQTLRVLRICRHPLSWSSRAQALFGGTVFPFLTDLHLFGVLCSKLDVSYHFPQLRSVSLPLSLVPSGLPLSNLPRSLQSLTFYDVNKLNFDTIVDGLKNLLIPVESLKNFRLSAKFTFDEDPDVFESICELSEHLKCVVVSDLCKERRIRLSCHEWDPILGDALETVETETTDEEFGVPAFAEEELEYVEREEEADETTSDEEEDLDFDAEDGVEFRHLWSEEKLAELAQAEEKVCSD